jgi:hypothetical protein
MAAQRLRNTGVDTENTRSVSAATRRRCSRTHSRVLAVVIAGNAEYKYSGLPGGDVMSFVTK